MNGNFVRFSHSMVLSFFLFCRVKHANNDSVNRTGNHEFMSFNSRKIVFRWKFCHRFGQLTIRPHYQNGFKYSLKCHAIHSYLCLIRSFVFSDNHTVLSHYNVTSSFWFFCFARKTIISAAFFENWSLFDDE